MATSKFEISSWFDRGVKQGATHMIVVCDTFDHEDYPCYAESPEDAQKVYDEHNGPNMQRVMEVYDLRMDKASQLAKYRAFHL
jgi:hypothetical protein